MKKPSPDTLDFAAEMTALKASLAVEVAREEAADAGIAELLRSQAQLPAQLGLSLSRLRSRLALLGSDAQQLGSALHVTSMLAESVSGKVRDLDLAKGRVVDCLQRVEDLQDLKLCTEGVTSALRGEDYEVAATHVQRFLSLDEELFAVEAEEGSPDEGDLAASYRILNAARGELTTLAAARFEEAVAADDAASVQRFLKLFPQLHQARLGITKFGAYLNGKIKAAAEANLESLKAGGEDKSRSNVLYADGLTLLFEGIARVLEVHHPIVQSCYAPEHMLQLITILQEECDSQAELIIAEFVTKRSYTSKAGLVETYARQAHKSAGPTEPDRLDPLELDVLLSEVTLLHTRGELYLRFVRRKVGADIAGLADSHPDKAALSRELEELLRGCGLARRMQELIGHYISMELYYMEESLRKAVRMDSRDDPESLTSSMVEDVFFIVRKSVRRSLSSGSVDCVCAMLNNAATLLETAFAALLKAQLKEGYMVSGSVAEAYLTVSASYSNVLATGKMGMAEGERSREKFLLALNNAAASEKCLAQLKATLEADMRQHLGESEAGKAKAAHSLGLLADVGNRLKDVARSGLDSLVAAAVKPRIRNGLEGFMDYTHSPTEEEFDDFEVNDPWVQGFLAQLDDMLQGFQTLLVESCYHELVGAVGSEAGRQLEKAIRKSTFNRLGGLQLDKEVRELCGYLSSAGGWAVRERLGRLSAIAALLNSESLGEAKEFLASAAAAVSADDARALLARRSDLPVDEIRRLVL